MAALPYLPVVVALSPWFAPVAALSLVLSLVDRRWLSSLVAVTCLATQVSWQLPFFEPSATLPAGATRSITTASPNPIDAYARVMTLNVYKGSADPASIVRLVNEERIEVLALQETTDGFVRALEAAGIGRYLPYSTVASSDGVYGNGLWSVTPLADPAHDEVGSSASAMPAGTVAFDDGRAQVRFVSVHTTSPTRGYWSRWKRSLDELGAMRARGDVRYVFMGDFNATYDHAPFRDFLGDRFSDAALRYGHGLMFTWPANRSGVPRFAAIDHVVVDRGVTAGRVEVRAVPGSDHAALLATIAVS
nr:endonuclease/exonuclease/phosphatase family protein [Bifidobacterium sp. DSM 109958]